MAYNQVEQAALAAAQPVVESLGYELVDVAFEKEVQNWVLVIYIHKSGGVTIDDCEIVTRVLDPILDANPIINGRHDFLSVSSPGLERPMKTERDWQRSIGKELVIKVFTPQDGQKALSGALAAYDEEWIHIKNGDEMVVIPRKNIASAKLKIHF
ncbi:MAG: ribosome maturation factor RimP [Christensenellales bacterium]